MNDLLYRCTKCGAHWSLKPSPLPEYQDGYWSLDAESREPGECCDNSLFFLSVIVPVPLVA